MIKKRKVKSLYINVVVCDKCGAEMCPTDTVFATYPVLYQYKCSNPYCEMYETFSANDNLGQLIYEFEDDDNV